jgi:hypothetical protein
MPHIFQPFLCHQEGVNGYKIRIKYFYESTLGNTIQVHLIVLINSCLMHGEHWELQDHYHKFVFDIHVIKRLWNVHKA